MLEKLLKELKEYRKYLSDVVLGAVSIVCNDFEIDEAIDSFKEQYPDIKIERICLASAICGDFTNYTHRNIPVEKLEDNFKATNLTVFASFNDNEYGGWKNIIDYLNAHKTDMFYYYSEKFTPTRTALYAPSIEVFYEVHKKAINQAFKAMHTLKSKTIFAEKLKSIITGRSGYLKNNNEPEYFPNIKSALPQKGDTIIDVGISEWYPELTKYSEIAGENGKVLAFEASSIEFAKIEKTLDKKKYNNIELINLGLWDKEETLKISNDIGGSSVIFDYLNKTTDCKLVKLDDYVNEHNINKVDYIKMDIEGAEPKALQGAEETIKRFRPTMAICIYHDPSHLFELINYINSLYLYYNFHLCHHSTYFPETVMYAVPKNGKEVCLYKFLHKISIILYNLGKSIKEKLNYYKNKFLVNKIINSQIIVYGAGSFFDQLKQEQFFQNANIIAVSDIKYTENGNFDGHKAITPLSLPCYKDARIFIAMKHPNIAHNYLKKELKEEYNNLKFIN